MKKFRNVPALVTLLAGFVMAIFMILEKFTLMKFLWILVSVMIAFYVAGIDKICDAGKIQDHLCGTRTLGNRRFYQFCAK